MTTSLGNVEAIRAAADRERMTQIKTPCWLAPAAPKIHQIWRQTASTIRHSSAMHFNPADDKAIDLAALDAAIRVASIETRAAIKSNLRALGLIPG